ncbi:hypothetical protein HHK36_009940 [Tetracentron sinense]|uniref:Helicase ATP-binding domain-containing protein n=1 Tax=Tetracentron sinense TaxID=13715 RepID=A0A835DIM5_TETSI|nr:hypothetical protein HHK36_009940 [Tetracentron sinense]
MEMEEDFEEYDDGELSPADSPSSDEDRKSQNVAALVKGNLVVRRQPLLPRVLSVADGAAVARKPFKPPCPNMYNDQNEQLVRRLWARKRFVPWGSSRPALVAVTNNLNIPSVVERDVSEESVCLPPGVEPLVLWQPEESEKECGDLNPIVVDPLLVRFLRPHQREGVQFMFECVAGLSSPASISGCILADDMGLGKTLQSITLLYTLLHQGFDGKPMVRKVIIVTPTSLVSNWESEIKKWIGERVQLIALCESTRDDVISGIDSFTRPRSPFQTFRMHSSKFDESGSCDLLICDEAHRLKNDQTLTNRALAALSCRRRILLSGTPMQNDLEEFFAMVNFTNPGVLGDAAYFRRYYEFILRRTNALLSNHLPPKLIYDTIKSGSPGTSGFEDCMRFFPPEMFSGRSGSWTGGDGAAARVLEGRAKEERVYIYRFLSTGTIEEKVYQRPDVKGGLQKVIQQEQTDCLKTQGNFSSTEDLRDLFTFHENVRSCYFLNVKFNPHMHYCYSVYIIFISR